MLHRLRKIRIPAVIVLVLGLTAGIVLYKDHDVATSTVLSSSTAGLTVTIPDNNYNTVQLTGSFSDWQTVALEKTSDDRGLAQWTAHYSPAYGDQAFGFYIDGSWQTPGNVVANGTTLRCHNDAAQYIFTLKTDGGIIMPCTNIPALSAVTVVYKPLARPLPASVHFKTSLNGWQEVEAQSSADGLYWYHFAGVTVTPDAEQQLGAIVDGVWYNGDHLFANQQLLTCTNDAGVVRFVLHEDGSVQNSCTTIARRNNLQVTYIGKNLAVPDRVQIAGSPTGWQKVEAPALASEPGHYRVLLRDVAIGTMQLGVYVNGQWSANANTVLVNGTILSQQNAAGQLEFCVANDGRITQGSCQ